MGVSIWQIVIILLIIGIPIAVIWAIVSYSKKKNREAGNRE